MSSGSLQPEGQKRAGAAGPEHQSRAQDKAGKHKEALQHCAQRDRFLLAPSLKRDCNRAGEVKSIWAQLVDIFQQSQVPMCLRWCKPHDSGSPGRQPWAQHWVHQVLETRGIETPSASDSVSPLTQMPRREPRSPLPLPGLWSLHSVLKEEITSSSTTKSSCYSLESSPSQERLNSSSVPLSPIPLAAEPMPPQLETRLCTLQSSGQTHTFPYTATAWQSRGRSPLYRRHQLSQPEKPGTCLYLPQSAKSQHNP